MLFWLLAALVAAFVLWYALAGRAWLKMQPWAQGFFANIEPLETALYKKSETMLVARLMSFGGLIVTAYDALAAMAPSLDLTPLTSILLAKVPQEMRGMVVSGATLMLGLLIAWLRKRTSKPLDLVAAPTTPETVAAEAKVDSANAQAVAAVQAVQG